MKRKKVWGRVNRNWKSLRNSQSGFTLVELVAVMIILGLLAGLVGVGIVSRVEKAKIQTTRSQISSLDQAISTFHLDCGFYPESLDALINAPASGRSCKNYTPGGYLTKKEVPTDPWNNRYNYAAPGIHNTESYDLWSNGPDAEEGTADDITSWATSAQEE